MKVVGIIPARFASTRFPGKPLADLGGKSMIRRVYEQCAKSKKLDHIVVATDDKRIADHVKGWKGNVVMTKADHQSGTDRCHEAMEIAAADSDYIINIQGDEPFIHPEQIDILATLLEEEAEIATLIKKIEDPADISNPNVVKVVSGTSRALYFSRSPIPFIRGINSDQWLSHHDFYRHIGIYAYRRDVLQKLTELPESTLEKAESLEQLRWLQHGFIIKVAQTTHHSPGIDTPEDLEKALKFLK